MAITGALSFPILCTWLVCAGTALGHASQVEDPTCAAAVLQRSASTQLQSAEESGPPTDSSFSLVDAGVSRGEVAANSGFSAAVSRLGETVELITESRSFRILSTIWLEPSLQLLDMTRRLFQPDPNSLKDFNIKDFNIKDFNIEDFNLTDFNLSGLNLTDDMIDDIKAEVLANLTTAAVVKVLDALQPTLRSKLSTYVFITIVAFISWCCNKKYQRGAGAEADANDFDHWQHGICSCCARGSKGMCCLACFCPSVRWANTVRRVGFMGFWMAWGIFFVACRGTELVNWYWASYLVAVALGAYFRQQMRHAYNMKSKGGCSWVTDCCLHAVCAPCAIVQEARQADEAFRVGLPVAIQPSWKEKLPLSAKKDECCPWLEL